MTDILNELSALAAAIHYPECWDTAAYPDLLSALREVTASAGCSVCKPQVEQDPVGEGTDDRAIADTVNTLRDIAINFHAADQLRARIAHVVVPRLKRIKNLKARAHDHLALLGAERNRALKAEQERDALRSQLDLVTWALEHLLERGIAPPDRNCSCHISPPCNDCVEWSGLREAVEHAESALAAVREPVSQHVPGEQHRVETDTHTIVLGNPPEEPDDWPEDDFRRHNCDAMGCGRAHVLARIRRPPSSPAGEGGDRG